MWFIGLIITAILFLLFCLRGFHAAMREEDACERGLVNKEEPEIFKHMRDKPSPMTISKTA
jgi:hypothetical protein